MLWCGVGSVGLVEILYFNVLFPSHRLMTAPPPNTLGGQAPLRMYFFLRLSFVILLPFGARFLPAVGAISSVFSLMVVGGATMTGKAGLLPWKRIYRKATAVASAAG